MSIMVRIYMGPNPIYNHYIYHGLLPFISACISWKLSSRLSPDFNWHNQPLNEISTFPPLYETKNCSLRFKNTFFSQGYASSDWDIKPIELFCPLSIIHLHYSILLLWCIMNNNLSLPLSFEIHEQPTITCDNNCLRACKTV